MRKEPINATARCVLCARAGVLWSGAQFHQYCLFAQLCVSVSVCGRGVRACVCVCEYVCVCVCVGLCACVLHDDDVGLNVLGCRTDILRTYI